MRIQIQQFVWIAAVAGLCVLWAGCGGSTKKTLTVATDATTACQSDIDCKGDRICVQSQCVAPDDATNSTNNSTTDTTHNSGGTGGSSGSSNYAPVVQNGTLAVPYNTATKAVLTGSDADADALTYTIVSNAAHGNVVIGNTATGAYTYTPAAGYNGSDAFAFKANDGTIDSNIATVIVTVQPQPANPGAPSNLTATWISDSKIRIQWTDNSFDEQGFRIERKANNETVFTQLATVLMRSVLYDDIAVLTDEKYTYRVRAVGTVGDSGPSNEVVVYTTPAAPGSLQAKRTDIDKVELTWTDQASFETGYSVEQATDATHFAAMATLPANATAFTATSLLMWTTYTWRVVAVANARENFVQKSMQIFSLLGPYWQLPDTGQSLCYDASSVITCPTTGTAYFGQDAQYGTNVLVYTDNGDGTITDNVTNLMWQKQDDGAGRAWADAVAYCAGLTLATYSDWRLPNRYALQSIVDYGAYSPSIDSTNFPGTALNYYWSSSSRANFPNVAWVVYFDDGSVASDSKTSSHYARCVRP